MRHKGNSYISPNRDEHENNMWKKANSIEDLNDRITRNGTYDKDLNRRLIMNKMKCELEGSGNFLHMKS